MEADPGKEKWNYPIFGYTASATKYSNGRVEVQTRISYAKDSRGEYQKSPRIEYTKTFRYYLTLNSDGQIVGGTFYRNSAMIDMLWMPLRPKQGKQPGNQRGNPHVDVNKVLAIWRASVSDDIRKKWPIIDPPEEDRVEEFVGLETLAPVQGFPVEEEQPAEEAAAEATSEEPAEEESADDDEPADDATEPDSSEEVAEEQPAE
jgi:hypothetical protein